MSSRRVPNDRPERRGARGSDRYKSTHQLNQDIRAWIETWNDDPQPLRLDQDRRPHPRIDQTYRTTFNNSGHERAGAEARRDFDVTAAKAASPAAPLTRPLPVAERQTRNRPPPPVGATPSDIRALDEQQSWSRSAISALRTKPSSQRRAGGETLA
jgi:hypothetical protein